MPQALIISNFLYGYDRNGWYSYGLEENSLPSVNDCNHILYSHLNVFHVKGKVLFSSTKTQKVISTFWKIHFIMSSFALPFPT